jgi:hypothetical protein
MLPVVVDSLFPVSTFAGGDFAAYPTAFGAQAAHEHDRMFQIFKIFILHFFPLRLYNDSTTGKTPSASYLFERSYGMVYLRAPQRQHTVYGGSLESVNLMENQSFAALTVLNLFCCFCLIFTLFRPKTLLQSENSTTAPR